MQANPNTVPAEQPASPMLSELGIDLIEHFRAQGRAVTWVNRWKAHLEPYFGAMAADSVNDEVVAAYVDLRRKQGATDITIETELGVLIRVYTLAVENGKLSKRPRIKRPNARWSCQAEKRKAEREKAAQLALQTVHDCPKCRKVLHQLFLKNPAAIELYKRDVEADRADRTIAIQEENPCQCCHLAPVARAHGNSKLCIPCRVVHSGESKREGTRRHRSRQRGDAPVEEVMLCEGCGEILEPDPDTGRVHGSTQYCDKCAKERDRLGKGNWKKNKSAEARAQAGRHCQGLKIVDGWIRQCGLWWVPEKSMKQEFCNTECGGRTQGILYRLDPKTATYYKDNASKTRKLAKIALQLEPKLAEAEAAKAEVERLAQRLAWRPRGFQKWPAEDQLIGLWLIENPTLENREIGQRLDDKSRLKCPFGETWERSLTTPGTGANRMSFIRGALRGRPAA